MVALACSLGGKIKYMRRVLAVQRAACCASREFRTFLSCWNRVHHVPSCSSPLYPLTARRHACCDAAEAPSQEEVSRAFASLGMSPNASQQAVRAEYLRLAKANHPDVLLQAQKTDAGKGPKVTMSDINGAYETLQRFFKVGAKTCEYVPSDVPRGAPQPETVYWESTEPHEWHTENEGGYGFGVPWASMNFRPFSGDDPIFESIASQFFTEDEILRPRSARRGGNRGKNQRKAATEGQTPRQTQKQQRARQADCVDNDDVWNEQELQAILNMQEDGKSFEFIANALNRSVDSVIAAFNEVCSAQRHSDHPTSRSSRRRRSAAPTEDGEYDFPFVEVVHMNDDGEPLDGQPYRFSFRDFEEAGGFEASPQTYADEENPFPFSRTSFTRRQSTQRQQPANKRPYQQTHSRQQTRHDGNTQRSRNNNMRF